MARITDTLKKRVLKAPLGASRDRKVVSTRDAILAMLTKELKNPDDSLEFYVSQDYLAYAIEALNDADITRNYTIIQTNQDNVFRATPVAISYE